MWMLPSEASAEKDKSAYEKFWYYRRRKQGKIIHKAVAVYNNTMYTGS